MLFSLLPLLRELRVSVVNSPANLLLRRLRGQFRGFEAAGFVRAVAERAAARLSAAAQRHERLIGRQGELVPLLVDQRKRTVDHERAVRAETNDDVGHF